MSDSQKTPRIGIDRQMVDVLAVLMRLYEEARTELEGMEDNTHARSIDFDITVRYEGEDSFVVGEWAGDWVELIDGEHLEQRKAQTRPGEALDE